MCILNKNFFFSILSCQEMSKLAFVSEYRPLNYQALKMYLVETVSSIFSLALESKKNKTKDQLLPITQPRIKCFNWQMMGTPWYGYPQIFKILGNDFVVDSRGFLTKQKRLKTKYYYSKTRPALQYGRVKNQIQLSLEKEYRIQLYNTVELDFSGRQNKRQLDFKRQNENDRFFMQ